MATEIIAVPLYCFRLQLNITLLSLIMDLINARKIERIKTLQSLVYRVPVLVTYNI